MSGERTSVVIQLEESPQGVIVPVKAQPGARRNGVAGEHAGALKVQVTQAPEDGKATEAVLELLADVLHIRRAQVKLLSGATSRHKRFLVSGLSLTDVANRLQAEVKET